MSGVRAVAIRKWSDGEGEGGKREINDHPSHACKRRRGSSDVCIIGRNRSKNDRCPSTRYPKTVQKIKPVAVNRTRRSAPERPWTIAAKVVAGTTVPCSGFPAKEAEHCFEIVPIYFRLVDN